MPKFGKKRGSEVEVILYLLVVTVIVSVIAAWLTDYTIANYRKGGRMLAADLMLWMLQEIEDGNFEKAYRICRIVHRRKAHGETFKDFLWNLYREAVVECEEAMVSYNEAVGQQNIDVAIERLRTAERRVTLTRAEVQRRT